VTNSVHRADEVLLAQLAPLRLMTGRAGPHVTSDRKRYQTFAISAALEAEATMVLKGR
jgi:hypothetical protein